MTRYISLGSKLTPGSVRLINPHMNKEKTHIFEYAGSAWTPIAYGYHMKAMGSEIPMITVCAAINVLWGLHGPCIFVLGSIDR